jgi:phosphatidylinositol-3-phosphatase
VSLERADRCDDCGAPLASGQRYCLGCGRRLGPRTAELAELLRRVGERATAGDHPAQTGAESEPGVRPHVPHPTSGRRARGRVFVPISALRLPPARISALLVLAFVGFGVLLGSAARPHVDGTLAASAHPLRLVLPPSANGGSGATPPASSASGGEPEQPEPTSTPEAATGSTTPAKAPASSHGTSPSSSSGGAGTTQGHAHGGSASKLPPVKHVFVVMLSSQPYAAVFGPESPAHYLQGLERRGALLVRYDAVAHQQLANGLALISGQGPTAETAANCPTYADVAPASSGADGQLLGNGCVYPGTTPTLAGQLSARRLTWRAYVEGLGEAGSPSPVCGHPALGQADPTSAPAATGGAYATYRNPFVYFHAVIDSAACAANDVGLNRLKPDLLDAKRTPSFAYVVPDRCHDANPSPCAPGAESGLAPADRFLEAVVPQIIASRAYRDGGLLVITVDEAPSSGEFADSSSCCGQPQFPNLAAAASGVSPRGGGTVGALLLSPFIKGGTTSQQPYNHFSLLRTIEDLFALKHLGYAALPKVSAFEASTFSAYSPR